MLRYTCYFFLLFCVAAIANRYDEWLTLPPASIHQWRQADGEAIVWHYAENPQFSEVVQFNLFQKGDAHAMGELPVLYWLSGLITRNWNYPAYPMRWIGLAIMFAGFWAFGWAILKLTQKPAIAVFGTGILMTSPVLAYYGPNFLPDAPAFCFVLMTTACLVVAELRQNARWILIASICAAVAIMLKLSMAILPLTLTIVWAIGRRRRWWQPTSIWLGRTPILAIFITFCAVAACRWWIFQYNSSHQATYFFSGIRPIWQYDWPAVREILKGILYFGLPAYGSAGLYLAALGSAWLWLKNRKSLERFWDKTLIFTTLGCATFVLLWFRMLCEHDYYAICLMVFPALLLLRGILLALQRYGEKIVLLALAICWLSGMAHSHFVLRERLHEAYAPPSTRNLPPEAFLLDIELTEAGIPAVAKIICPEDPSPNIALLALKRHGWSAYNFGDRITADTLKKYSEQYGLSHLALRDSAIYGVMYQQFFPNKVLETKGWHLYSR